MEPMMNDYKLVLASEVGARDGMALELAELDGERVAEVFEDNETKRRRVKFYTLESVPLEAIEWLLERARATL